MKLVASGSLAADKRTKSLRLTPEGEKLESELTGSQMRLLESALGGDNAGLQAPLIEALQRIAASGSDLA